ncbi:hypothetical protein [Botrimarina mediterranea]|uniref:hypothetical protein n=1 Tax=Botrimarina mediterranea TaxID=2528022 RepID=UPI00118C58A3|nr:hypothetical protein K2D_46560 [Planctomycetes bacterium K2D]
MPASKKRPKNAFVIRDFESLEQYAQKFAEGFFNLLILIGPAGVAKSQTVKQAVGDKALRIEGSATAFGIYRSLFQNRDKPVIIDDVDSLYTDRECVRLLKCVCQTDPVKLVQWHTGAAGDGKEVPKEFETTSKVIIIANEWKTLSENVRAVENRGHLLFFEPSPAAVHQKVADWFWDQEVYDFFGQNLHLLPGLSMRHYVQAAELKAAGMEWLDILHREGFAEKTVLVAKIKNDPKFTTEAQRAKAFKEQGGGGRSTYFAHAKKLVGKKRIDVPHTKLKRRKPPGSKPEPRLRVIGG